jgi:hypothetical protein
MKKLKLIITLTLLAMICGTVLNAKTKEKEYTFYMFGAYSKNPKDKLFGLVDYVEPRQYKGKITIKGDKVTMYCFPEQEKQEFEEQYKEYLQKGISSIEYHRTKPKERKNRRSIIDKELGNYFYPWLRFTTYKYGEKGFFEAVKNDWLYKNQYVEITKETGDKLLGNNCEAEERYPRESPKREKFTREIYANTLPHLPMYARIRVIVFPSSEVYRRIFTNDKFIQQEFNGKEEGSTKFWPMKDILTDKSLTYVHIYGR